MMLRKMFTVLLLIGLSFSVHSRDYDLDLIETLSREARNLNKLADESYLSYDQKSEIKKLKRRSVLFAACERGDYDDAPDRESRCTDSNLILHNQYRKILKFEDDLNEEMFEVFKKIKRTVRNLELVER
jgi:hypothetical protein